MGRVPHAGNHCSRHCHLSFGGPSWPQLRATGLHDSICPGDLPGGPENQMTASESETSRSPLTRQPRGSLPPAHLHPWGDFNVPRLRPHTSRPGAAHQKLSGQDAGSRPVILRPQAQAVGFAIWWEGLGLGVRMCARPCADTGSRECWRNSCPTFFSCPPGS